MIRFATMKYRITRGHHKRRWNEIYGRWDKQWIVRETVRKCRGVTHLFIHDEGTRWKSPCGQAKSDTSFDSTESAIRCGDVPRALEGFLDGAYAPVFMKRCQKCVAWARKNREALIAGEKMGEKA